MLFLPTFNIKLCPVNQYTKIFVRKNSDAFHYVKAKSPKDTEAKLKEGLSVGLQLK